MSKVSLGAAKPYTCPRCNTVVEDRSFDCSHCNWPGADTTVGEVRVTDPDTGGAKGRKPEEYALIPVEALAEVARVYGYGAKKYEPNNWRRGYAWSLSYSALQRHLNAFWRGEQIDPESGLPHLAHAAFHILSLLTFSSEDRYKEKDDRWQ